MSRPRARWMVLVAIVVGLFCTASSCLADREVSEESKLFEKLKNGVFTIYSEYGKGTGFLISDDGLVMTNAHVLSTSTHIRVVLDPEIKVEAQIVEIDKSADIALIQIHPSHAQGRSVLPLAYAEEDRAFMGERVIAIGSPLAQDRVLTTGIVSSISDDVIMSDVNINPGNSGGPMLTLDGVVVGVNTFVDQSDRIGPGLSGTIRIREAIPVVERAQRKVEQMSPPSDRLCPVMPEGQFPLEALEAAAKASSWPSEHYDAYLGSKVRPLKGGSSTSRVDKEDFQVIVGTPPQVYHARKQAELAVASEDESGAYDAFADLVQWTGSLDRFPPVVALTIAPRAGATSGSQVSTFFSSLLTGAAAGVPSGHLEYEYKGDCAGAELFVNGRRVEELRRTLAWIPMSFVGSSGGVSASGKDLARSGYFVFDPGVFLHTDGEWPDVEVHVRDGTAESDDEDTVIEIPRASLERIAIDFAPWFRQQRERSYELVVGPGVTR